MSRLSTILLGSACAVLLAGCGSLGGPEVKVQVYSPDAKVQPDPSWPRADWHLTVETQAATQMLDSVKIAVRPTPNALQTYKGAAWADTAPELLQVRVIEAFEDSGKVASVRRGGGRGDIGLMLEVRQFETVYRGAAPEAVIELQARLVDFRGRGVASKRFRQVVPGTAADVPTMVDAFGQAMAAISGELVGWTLVEGNRLRAMRAAEEKK
jgi:cholesterol transport system auxiliary component